jgi:phosphonopyruvate decarboxylase
MIDPARFVDHLAELGVTMYTGVPDSLLKSFGRYVHDALPREQHVIAANEGAAVGIALGHHLRTGEVAAVYLQNSGFGNTINPLLSLADPDVYGVPMLVIVGWRGQPGVKDEPQHLKQGRIQEALLDALELPWAVLPDDPAEAEPVVERAVRAATETGGPSFLLVAKGTFADAPPTGAAPAAPASSLPSREEVLTALVAAVGDGPVLVSTTGMLSRELFELRERDGSDGSRDFLTVGGMGHASSIALGVALREPDLDRPGRHPRHRPSHGLPVRRCDQRPDHPPRAGRRAARPRRALPARAARPPRQPPRHRSPHPHPGAEQARLHGRPHPGHPVTPDLDLGGS